MFDRFDQESHQSAVRRRGSSSWRDEADGELVAACVAGDADAWDVLLERYQGFIYGITLKLGVSGSDAEDLFQEVCLKLYRHLSTLRNAERLSSWLGAVVRQEVWRYRRRRSGAPQSDFGDESVQVAEDEAPGPEEQILALERAYLVRECLGKLPEGCRELLGLLYAPEPASYAETSRRLGMPIGSIGPRRARCIERLKRKLDEFDL